MKVEKAAEKIENMEIRGAGEIAKATAKALRDRVNNLNVSSTEEGLEELRKSADILLESRPTAVSLPNAIRKVFSGLEEANSVKELKEKVISNSESFIEKAEKAKEKIGDIGSGRIEDGYKVLTHCNSQAVLSILKKTQQEGKQIEVYSTESRPRCQGRLTAKQLSEENISVTQIVDSAARYFMKDMDLVLVGADAIGANGAVANKIGTSQIALVAEEARVDFLVAAETYKFSPGTVAGELIEIEERSEREVWDPPQEGIKIRNPAFDFTPPEYIDIICTEIGLISPHMAYFVLREEFDWELNEVI